MWFRNTLLNLSAFVALGCTGSPKNVAPKHSGSAERAVDEVDINEDGRVVGIVKMCLNRDGRVESLRLLKSTGYPDYDAKLMNKMRGWKYRPYIINGKSVPVCSSVTLVYIPDQVDDTEVDEPNRAKQAPLAARTDERQPVETRDKAEAPLNLRPLSYARAGWCCSLFDGCYATDSKEFTMGKELPPDRDVFKLILEEAVKENLLAEGTQPSPDASVAIRFSPESCVAEYSNGEWLYEGPTSSRRRYASHRFREEAWVYTFYFDQHKEWAYVAFPTQRACNESRDEMPSSHVSKLSRCEKLGPNPTKQR